MRTFCISDIHGNLTAFNDVLNQAHFKLGEDTLYVLGDMIDGGDESFELCHKLYSWQKKYPDKIFVCKGNHELLMTSTIIHKNEMALVCWTFSNHGAHTLNSFMQANENLRIEILNWINSLPIFFENGPYYLTHSLPYNKDITIDDLDRNLRYIHSKEDPAAVYAVWERVDIYMKGEYVKNKILISGHSITNNYNEDESDFSVYFNLAKGYINIDCGAKALPLLKSNIANVSLALLEIPSYNVWYSQKVIK